MECVIFAIKDLKKVKKSTSLNGVADRVVKYGKSRQEVLSAIDHLVETKVLLKVGLYYPWRTEVLFVVIRDQNTR